MLLYGVCCSFAEGEKNFVNHELEAVLTNVFDLKSSGQEVKIIKQESRLVRITKRQQIFLNHTVSFK